MGGDFWCDSNYLEDLEGAPETVGGEFRCYKNRLVTLEGAPKQFKSLTSDLGAYSARADIPSYLLGGS